MAVLLAGLTCCTVQAQEIPVVVDPSPDASQDGSEFRQYGQIEITGSSIVRKEQTQALPVQIITRKDIQRLGKASLPQLIQGLAGVFNGRDLSQWGSPSGGHMDAGLHGMPTGTLVLLNGKRLAPFGYQSSTGKENNGVDLDFLPLAAVERIELLTDGASSLYGTDAIAGVINVQLKKRGANRAQASFGKYVTTMKGVGEVAKVMPTLTGSDDPAITFTGQDRTRRDGDTYTLATNLSLPVGDSGYVNWTAEYRDRSPSNRSGPDIRRQYSTAGDPRETTISRYLHRFGDGLSKDLNFFLNAGAELGNGFEVYGFGSYGYRDANGAGFYRRANDARNRDWANGGQPFYPDGFLPLIGSKITDIAGAAGVRGEAGGWNVDASINYGSNRLDYSVENSFNTSLGGVVSPRKFDAGGLRSGQTSVNFDAQRDINLGLGETSLAVGLEWRNENYKIVAGELASYVAGPYTFSNGAAPGAQVFPGFAPSTAIDKSRDSFAGYVELDADLNDMINVQVAGRYEHFSDFGDTLNGKFAARVEPIEGLALRGSISTGFRAPGMAQQFFSTTSTNNVNGTLIEIGTFPVQSPIARALGAQPLTPEKSVNIGGGVAFNMVRGLSVTVDYYNIKIKDRITLTENLQGADVVAILQAASVVGTSARFFINGIDTRTQGLDIVGSYRMPDFGLGKFTLTAGYNINDTKITDRRTFSGFTATRLFARAESFRLTDGQPSNKLNVGLDWEANRFGATFRANRYGKVFLPGPSTDITIAEGNAPGDLTLSPKWVADLELRFQLLDAVQLAAGANNLFDQYPDRLPYGVVNGYNYGLNNSFLPYSSQSPFGFSGRFLYGRVSVTF